MPKKDSFKAQFAALQEEIHANDSEYVWIDGHPPSKNASKLLCFEKSLANTRYGTTTLYKYVLAQGTDEQIYAHYSKAQAFENLWDLCYEHKMEVNPFKEDGKWTLKL